MLKSTVDVAPVAFLSTAQNQGGNFDYMLTSGASNRLLDGDKNVYGSDPFEMEYEEKPLSFDSLVRGYDTDDVDHAELFGFPLLNFDNLKKKLDPLIGEHFTGFTPRWMLPARIRNPHNRALSTSCLMIIIDS